MYFEATFDIGYSICVTFIILTGCSIIKRYWKYYGVEGKYNYIVIIIIKYYKGLT